MKNIDKVRQMKSEELIAFMKSGKCDKCTYNDTYCQHDMCTEGMTKWLEQESELTLKEVASEFINHCEKYNCEECCYPGYYCRFQFIVDNFNVIDGKIIRGM